MNGHGLKGRGPVWWVPFEEMTAETCQAKPDEIKRLVERLSSEVDKIPYLDSLASLESSSLFTRKNKK